MKTFLVFTDGEPLIIATAKEAVAEGRLATNLSRAGIDTFIAHELAVDRVRKQYGLSFEVIESQIRQGTSLRVVDCDGHHIFERIHFADLGPCIFHKA